MSLEKDVKIIIKKANKKMQPMLKSVFEFNKKFLLSSDQEKLLEKIIFAIQQLDRKFFVKDNKAYYDTALGIGQGQTISQPSTVARMLLLADLEREDDVLEIGAGSGWNACLIAYLVYPGNVLSVERIVKLKEKAEKNVSKLRNYLKQHHPEDYPKLQRLNFVAENIFEKGRSWKKKYDKIIFTAGIHNKEQENKIKQLAKKLLKQQGTLICPQTSGPMLIYHKDDKLKKFKTQEEYVFVPLIETH